jgi:hypothetical protein
MTVLDQSHLVVGQPVSSMLQGNAQNAPGAPGREVTAPGGPSVVAPAPTDVVQDVAGGSTVDYAHIIGASGAPGTRPSGDPFSTRPGSDSHGWKQV